MEINKPIKYIKRWIEMERKELFKGLTKEQIEKAKNCKDMTELMKLAKEEGIELTDEQLEAVSGGGCSQTSANNQSYKVCPMCGSVNIFHTFVEDFSREYHDCECHDCNHRWQVTVDKY